MWCFNFLTGFPGKGPSQHLHLLSTHLHGGKCLSVLAHRDGCCCGVLDDCVRKAFLVLLLDTLWQGACIHTETHWSHRSFLQVQICFHLRQFPNYVICEGYNSHISVEHPSIEALQRNWMRAQSQFYCLCIRNSLQFVLYISSIHGAYLIGSIKHKQR